MTSSQQYEFLKTAGRLFDGTAVDADRVQFAQQLAEDAEAQSVFTKFVAFDLDLEWLCGRHPDQKIFASEPTGALAPVEDCSFTSASTVALAKSGSLSPVLTPQKSSFFSGPALCYAALVALCFYGSFAIVVWNLHPDKLPSTTNGTDSPVAVVRDTTDVQWSKKAFSKPTESSIRSGEPLKIDSGLVQLELKAGTKLVVEGPAEWSVDGDNSVSLRVGKLLADVPRQAIGFALETPTAKVVDLGTEFGVEVSKSGDTEVQVLAGKVQLRPATAVDKPSAREQQITLMAGEARKVERSDRGGDVVIRKVAAAPERFVKGAAPEIRQIVVGGAIASSSYPSTGISVNNLINGSGLRGECHSCKSGDGTMWHAEVGKVKDEYVLFDLGHPYCLRSMKVWNYNDPYVEMHRWRGVKQADIYVSSTGQGTPLDHPDEWKLLAEDVQFEPGTGTSEYDTPKQIPLEDTTGRFVAIVIDEALGHDPRGSNLAMDLGDVVGLSEVQFFGVRANSPKNKPR